MFYRYDIRNNGVEDILYLYMTMKYEYSSEFTLEDESVNASCNKFIKTNDIKFKGNKICIVMDGTIVKCMYLNKDSSFNQEKYLVDDFMVNICLDDNAMCEISLREYLLSVLFSKYMNSLHIETLKAMAVLFSTFAFKMMEDNNYILSTNRFAIYKPSDYYKAENIEYDKIIEKLNNAINEVDGVYLAYQGNYILPFMHYSNSGKTLSNKHYPYLSSVKSLWDLTSPYYIEVSDFSFDELKNKLNVDINNQTTIKIVNQTFHKIKFGNAVFSIQEIKSLLNLKSDDIYIIVNSDGLKFITKGWGNSYGLSIYASTLIANDGNKYNNILKYFFPKTNLYKKEIKAFNEENSSS